MNKTQSIEALVAENIGDGDTIFVGGFGQCIPFAIAHEIVRQGRKDLTLCRSGADILFDLLIAAGCVRKVIVGYIGNPGIGMAHAFRRAAESGSIEIEDWTNFSMILRLHAAALGLPFIPAATLRGGDLPGRLDLHDVTCPYTGEQLTAIPALRPDVAILHAHRSDGEGNLQISGLPGDTVEGALASERVIATVEEIVAPADIRAHAERTIVPGFRVNGVAKVPFGAHPSYVDGRYDRDDAAYKEWDGLARDPAALADWINRNVRGAPDFQAYLDGLEAGRLAALTFPQTPPEASR